MSARRVAAVLAAVGAIPVVCLVGVLALGRALEESQVAEGTLTTPEEAARRAEENRRRFLAMTPAEHLAGARHRLSLNPRPGLGAGGDLHGATLHLDAISPDAGVHAEVVGLRDEIDQRRLRIYAAFEGHVLRPPSPPARPSSTRCNAPPTRPASTRGRTRAPLFRLAPCLATPGSPSGFRRAPPARGSSRSAFAPCAASSTPSAPGADCSRYRVHSVVSPTGSCNARSRSRSRLPTCSDSGACTHL